MGLFQVVRMGWAKRLEEGSNVSIVDTGKTLRISATGDGGALEAVDLVVDDNNFSVIAGTNAQSVFESIDGEIDSLEGSAHAHGISHLNAITGGSLVSTLAAIGTSDTIIGGLRVVSDGTVLNSMADIDLTPGDGEVTHSGDETGNLIIVSWVGPDVT